MEKTLKSLLELGLNEKEARVYLASLELGPATAQQIAAKAVVVRPTAYVAIAGLFKRGLMSQVTRGKKQYFQPEKPDRLAQILEMEKRQILDREQKLKAALPLLQSLVVTAGNRPEAKFYEGEEGLESLRQVFVAAKPKSLDLVVARKTTAPVVESNLWPIGGNAKVREISVRPIKVTSKPAPNRAVRDLVQPGLAFDGEVVIFGDQVALVSRGDQPYAILVRGADVSSLARLMFGGFWGSLS